jgi:hypothetical protein
MAMAESFRMIPSLSASSIGANGLTAVRFCMQPRLIYLNLNLNSESVDAFLSEPALEKCKTSSWSQSSSTF